MTPDAAALIRNYPFLKSVLSQQTPCKDAAHDRRMTARRGTMVCHRTKMHQRIGSVACCVTVMICCVCRWVKQLMRGTGIASLNAFTKVDQKTVAAVGCTGVRGVSPPQQHQVLTWGGGYPPQQLESQLVVLGGSTPPAAADRVALR